MNARDMIALLEYGKAWNKPAKEKTSRRNTKLNMEDLDLAEVYLKLKAKETKIKEAISQVEKMAKKDEKKEEKKSSFSAIEYFILATIAGPFIFLFELWAYNYAISYIKHMVH